MIIATDQFLSHLGIRGLTDLRVVHWRYAHTHKCVETLNSRSHVMVVITKSTTDARLVSSFTLPNYLLALVRRKFLEGVVRTRNVPKVGQRNQSCWLCWRRRERARERDREGGCWYGWSSLMKLGAFSCVGKGYNLYGNIFLSRTQGFLRLIKQGWGTWVMPDTSFGETCMSHGHSHSRALTLY